MERFDGLSRRAFLAATAGAAGFAGCSAPVRRDNRDQTMSRDHSEWPMYRRDPANTGRTTASERLKKGVSEVWNDQYPGEWIITSSPAIVDGAAYFGTMNVDSHVSASRTGDRGTLNGHFYSLDIETGERRWSFDCGPVHSSPAVAGGTAYFGSRDGYVYALSTETGEKQWALDTGAYVLTAPAIVDDTVYLANAAGRVLSLDRTDGSIVWERQMDGQIRYASVGVADDRVLVGSGRTVSALAAEDGSPEWQTETTVVYSTPLFHDGTVYVGGADRIHALDIGDGLERWQAKVDGEAYGALGSNVYSTPVVDDDTLYVGSDDHRVYAFDAHNGTRRWSYTTGGKVRSSPAIVDDTLYIGSYDGYLYAFDVSGNAFSVRWRASVGTNAIDCSPAVVDDTIYIGSFDGDDYDDTRMHAFSAIE